MKHISEINNKNQSKRFSAAKRAAALFLAFCACILAGVSGGLGFDARAESGENAVVMPSYIFDFTDFETFSLDYYANCTVTTTKTGMRCTATADDPHLSIGSPAQSGKNLVWIAVKYRGKVNAAGRGAEMYFTTNKRSLSESSVIRWQWNNLSTSWNTMIFRAAVFNSVTEPILYVRYDPLAGNGSAVTSGEWLETAYIAFFKTEADARNFDYNKYLSNKDQPTQTIITENWEKPPKSAGTEAMSKDNTTGSLKITESGDSLRISYTAAGKKYSYDLKNDASMRNGVLAGKDDLGRSQPDQFTVIDPDYVGRRWGALPTDVDSPERIIGVRGENGQRYVGIFYFLWLGTQGDWGEDPRDISKILDRYGTAAKDMDVWGNVYNTFFFAEPLYGYYRSTDTWVIRKHMELLTNAGVDFLYFDTTNNYIYETSALSIMKVCHEMNEQGYKAPQVVFYTNTNAEERVSQAYSAIYKKNMYPDTWFLLDGKPLIIAPESANINNFFTTRAPQWPNESHGSNTWPWIDWKWPQETYGVNNSEAISVSVAQHSGNGEFSTSGLYGYTNNRGRSYNGRSDSHTEDSYKLGTNLQLQFNRAITSDVPYVLVTGWNEWIAGRQEPNSKYNIRFIDTFNYEYSRDIEMSRGGYFDNYYMQLASNIAAVKGSAPIILRDDRRHINVAGSFSQWDKVVHYYTDPQGDMQDRNTVGYGGIEYKNDTGRNDITKIKVTGDTTYLYFYVECDNDIVHGTGGSWMQILLNTDNDATGWYGYDYIVNYTRKNDYTSTVAAYSGTNGAYGFKAKTDVTYQVDGNKMMVAVPLEALGINYYDKIDLQFKVIDSDKRINTMEQFYEDGDAAPLGRLNFTYKTYLSAAQSAEGSAVVPVKDRVFFEDDPETTAEETVTEPETEKETQTAETEETTAEEGSVTEPVTEAASETDAKTETDAETDEETKQAIGFVPGDINKDGDVNNKDVVELFRYVSGNTKAEDETPYDYNGDKEVNNKDVIALFRDVSNA